MSFNIFYFYNKWTKYARARELNSPHQLLTDAA